MIIHAGIKPRMKVVNPKIKRMAYEESGRERRGLRKIRDQSITKIDAPRQRKSKISSGLIRGFFFKI